MWPPEAGRRPRGDRFNMTNSGMDGLISPNKLHEVVAAGKNHRLLKKCRHLTIAFPFNMALEEVLVLSCNQISHQ